MATASQIRHYLAYWLQLSKNIVLDGKVTRLPSVIERQGLSGDRLSSDFEDLWATALQHPYTTYLEGTSVTIAELLSGEWEIVLCARCPMPVPLRVAGITNTSCPCHDMHIWPNSETLLPRLPVDSENALMSMCDRLRQSEYAMAH